MEESQLSREKEILNEIKQTEAEKLFVTTISASDLYAKLSALRIELLYLSSIRNEESSKRFAWASLAVSVVAIFISVFLSIHQDTRCAREFTDAKQPGYYEVRNFDCTRTYDFPIVGEKTFKIEDFVTLEKK